METTKTNAKLLSPVKVKPPDATSVFFGLAVVFSKELVYSMGAAVVVTAPVSISRGGSDIGGCAGVLHESRIDLAVPPSISGFGMAVLVAVVHVSSA